LGCSSPPEGRARWTLRLLADKVVEMQIVESVSHETVRQTLKNILQPHRQEMWIIPPEQNGEFVAHMEEVLDLYREPYDPKRLMVNMDEQPVQLIKETSIPIPAAPGRPERIDYEYERNGTADIFMFTEPLTGKSHVSVRERRTSIDWAQEVKELLDVRYPEADIVQLVNDNLNTHKIDSLYEAFEPEEARRLAKRLEIHYTPKHGSWLNIAEIELSALTDQCLDRRIPDMDTLRKETKAWETKAWETKRNELQKGIDWRFTTSDARIKLKRLYPKIQT
ncbi:MAG: IS630 family transposase, partial [Syntrophobacteraceae bacterium]